MSSNTKISIRFFDDHKVRAIWDEINNKWWFNVVDVVAVLYGQDDYTKANNYWRWLNRKLTKEQNELVSATHSFKFVASDEKKRLADTLDSVISLAKHFPNNKAVKFLDWLDTATIALIGRARKRHIPFLKAISSMMMRSGQRKVYNKFMLIFLGGYMILQDKSGKKYFKKRISVCCGTLFRQYLEAN